MSLEKKQLQGLLSKAKDEESDDASSASKDPVSPGEDSYRGSAAENMSQGGRAEAVTLEGGLDLDGGAGGRDGGKEQRGAGGAEGDGAASTVSTAAPAAGRAVGGVPVAVTGTVVHTGGDRGADPDADGTDKEVRFTWTEPPSKGLPIPSQAGSKT